MRLRLHPGASAEIDAAEEWYECERTGLGRDFLADVDRGLAAVAATPGTWARVGGTRRLRRFLLARFPYPVLYVVHRHEVRVFAVARVSRRPGYWRGRRFE